MTNGRPISKRIRTFLVNTVRSTWNLEVLLLMGATADRSWSVAQINGEIHGSIPLVEEVLRTLSNAKLIAEADSKTYRYLPAKPEDEALVEELKQLHLECPLALIKVIISAPNEKIQIFVDAFRLKE